MEGFVFLGIALAVTLGLVLRAGMADTQDIAQDRLPDGEEPAGGDALDLDPPMRMPWFGGLPPQRWRSRRANAGQPPRRLGDERRDQAAADIVDEP